MKIHRIADAWYWFEEGGGWKPEHARSGPFRSREAAYLWFVQEYEAKLPPHRLALWAEAVKRAGVGDPAHLMGLMMAICAGRSADFVMRSAWPVREHRVTSPDRRMLAAGDKEAA